MNKKIDIDCLNSTITSPLSYKDSKKIIRKLKTQYLWTYCISLKEFINTVITHD